MVVKFLDHNNMELQQQRRRRQRERFKRNRYILGNLSSDVFERRTSTGSEVFSLLTCLDDIKFVFLSFFTVIEAIWPKICAKPPSKNEKRLLPVDVRRSKTLLLKLPNSKPPRRRARTRWDKTNKGFTSFKKNNFLCLTFLTVSFDLKHGECMYHVSA